MKKIFAAGILFSLLALNTLPAGRGEPERLYANIIFTVFKLDHWSRDIERTLNLPIPEVFEESWIHAFLSLDITDSIRQVKTIEKEDIRFDIGAGSLRSFSIQVFEKNRSRFYFEHHRPSSASYIFYGSDSRIYLMKVLYSTGDRPVGLVGPGIRR